MSSEEVKKLTSAITLSFITGTQQYADTGNACRQPGYEEFMPTSVPEGCAPLVSDWVHLDPPPCGEGFPYPEEFWNCADIAITAGKPFVASTAQGCGGGFPQPKVWRNMNNAKSVT